MSKSKSLILGGAAGLLVGILLAFLFEYLDDSIRATEHVQEELAEQLVMLGAVPEFPRRADASPLAVAGLRERTSALIEPYRAIRTALHFVGADGPGSLIEVIAPTTGEGATTTAANLAVLLARAGRAVALVDANLRSPGVHSLFGLDNRIGLTSIMIGDVELHDAVCTVQGPDKLVVLPAGPEPPNPSELIASPRFAAVLQSLCDDGATVVVDCPPLLSASDGLVVGASARAVVLVTSARTGSRKRVRRAVALLRQANAPLVGVVLNRAGKHAVGYETSGTGSVPRRGNEATSRERVDLNGETANQHINT
jgi:capsular exopolysaccharide synthesis family protein